GDGGGAAVGADRGVRRRVHRLLLARGGGVRGPHPGPALQAGRAVRPGRRGEGLNGRVRRARRDARPPPRLGPRRDAGGDRPGRARLRAVELRRLAVLRLHRVRGGGELHPRRLAQHRERDDGPVLHRPRGVHGGGRVHRREDLAGVRGHRRGRRPGGGLRPALLAHLPARGRDGSGAVRLSRRPPLAPAARRLPGHRHPGLRGDHPRHRAEHAGAGRGAGALRHPADVHAVHGLVLGIRHRAGGAAHRPLLARAVAVGHPRGRGGGGGDGRGHHRLQGPVLRHLLLLRRRGGRAVRPLHPHHQPQLLRLREVDGGGGDGGGGRAGLHHRRHRRGGGAHPAAGGPAHGVQRLQQRPGAGAEGGPDPHAHLRPLAGGADAGAPAGAVRHPRGVGRAPSLAAPPPEGRRVSAAANGEPLLQAKDASIEFGGLKALQRFNLEIRQGDLQGLIGPNGAGKTTAFNVLTGVYEPTSGDVFVCGQRVNGKKPHRINRLGLARTFQNIRLFRALTALDNVRVACLSESRPVFSAERLAALRREGGAWAWMANGLDAWNNYYDWWRALLLAPGFLREEEELTRRAEQLLEVMGLSHRRDEEARNLPYGEQRRLEIARALGTRPRVLLLDEPAAVMNTREKADLMVLIRRLREQFSLGILVIEHDMKLVMGICEQITVLDHGETIAVGTPEKVRADRKVIEAYLGDSYLETHPEAAQEAAR